MEGKQLEDPISWEPDQPASRGATEYHNAVIGAPYYIESLGEFGNFAKNKIKENDLVIDFGAGTGVSTLELLKKINLHFKVWLIDNSASWLGKAYELFKGNPNIKCFLLQKKENRYSTLAETIGKERANDVISANTMHLIPNLKDTFKGIYDSLKPDGNFIFQSSNIDREDREKGVMMIDNCINRVHELSLEIIRTEKKFEKYKMDLDKRIEIAKALRKFIFPDARMLEVYIEYLKEVGFKKPYSYYKAFKVKYADFLKFLKVKALQVGILPEVGGKDATPEEINDRDEIVTSAAHMMFKEFKENNARADDQSFTSESVYISTVKSA
jgi:SAM-dependent methyltransferase